MRQDRKHLELAKALIEGRTDATMRMLPTTLNSPYRNSSCAEKILKEGQHDVKIEYEDPASMQTAMLLAYTATTMGETDIYKGFHDWKHQIAEAHAMFLAKASNIERQHYSDDPGKGPLSYELFSTADDAGKAVAGNFLLKESYPSRSAREAHDQELANGGVNGWAKFVFNGTNGGLVAKPGAARNGEGNVITAISERDPKFEELGGDQLLYPLTSLQIDPPKSAEYLCVQVNFNEHLDEDDALAISNLKAEDLIEKLGRPAGRFGEDGELKYVGPEAEDWRQEIYREFENYISELKAIADTYIVSLSPPQVEQKVINAFARDLRPHLLEFNAFMKRGIVKSPAVLSYIRQVLIPMIKYLSTAKTYHRIKPAVNDPVPLLQALAGSLKANRVELDKQSRPPKLKIKLDRQPEIIVVLSDVDTTEEGQGVFFCHGGLSIFHNEEKSQSIYSLDSDIGLHAQWKPASVSVTSAGHEQRLDVLASRACDKKFCEDDETEFAECDPVLKSSIINGRWPRHAKTIFEPSVYKEHLKHFIDKETTTTVVGHTPYGPIPVVHKTEIDGASKYLLTTDTQFTSRETNTSATILDASGNFWIYSSAKAAVRGEAEKITVLTTKKFLDDQAEECNGVLKYENDAAAYSFSVTSLKPMAKPNFEFKVGDKQEKSFSEFLKEAQLDIQKTRHALFATCGDVEGSVHFLNQFKEKTALLCGKKVPTIVSIGDVVGGAGFVIGKTELSDSKVLRDVNGRNDCLNVIGNRDLNKFRMIEELPLLFGDDMTKLGDGAEVSPVTRESDGNDLMCRIHSITRPKGYGNFTMKNASWKGEEYKNEYDGKMPISDYYQDRFQFSKKYLKARAIDGLTSIKHIFTS